MQGENNEKNIENCCDYLCQCLLISNDSNIKKGGTLEKLLKIVEKGATTELFSNDYEHSRINIASDWIHLLVIIFISSIASIIALEFIDKDKR